MTRMDPIEIETTSLPLRETRPTGLLVGIVEGEDGPELSPVMVTLVNAHSPVPIRELQETGELRGSFKEFHVLHVPGDRGPVRRIVLLGMGKRDKADLDTVRSVAAKGARTLRRLRCDTMLVDPGSFLGLPAEAAAQAVAEGIVLGVHRILKRVKSPPEDFPFRRLVLVSEPGREEGILAAARRGTAVAEATNLARDVGNEPGVSMTPRDLAATALEEGKRVGFEVEVLEEERMEELGMEGILAVGRGSEEPSRLIVLRHPRSGPRIALVGKGVTFDSGGVSLKPAKGMHRMKYDLGGAAAVLGAVQAAARLDLEVDLLGFIPSSENMPSGRSYKPGDVIRMHSGHHVEVTNTDAEGRMLLADALSYACEWDPDCIVDLATLTGGVVTALGHITSGILGTSEALVADLIEAGKATEEKLWRLPLFSEYTISLKSTVADLINSPTAAASPITAACFLSRFARVPWAHIDIAGTAWIEEDSMQYVHKPYLPKRGATGVGVRTLAAFLRRVEERFAGDREAFRRHLRGED